MRPLGLVAVFIAVVAATVGILTAPTGHADKQSFIDAVRTVDAPQSGYYPPSSIFTLGFHVCEELREGMSPMDAQRKLGIFGLQLPNFVAIAQHELCPDTLG